MYKKKNNKKKNKQKCRNGGGGVVMGLGVGCVASQIEGVIGWCETFNGHEYHLCSIWDMQVRAKGGQSKKTLALEAVSPTIQHPFISFPHEALCQF